MAGPDATPLNSLFDQLRDQLDLLDALIADTSTIAWLVDADVAADEVIDRIKLIRSAIGAKLRIAAAQGPVFTEGGTLSLDADKKRTLRPGMKEQIRHRIAERSLGLARGEMGVALRIAIEFTESAYSSPSAVPKWGQLQQLGYRSWAEIADEEEGNVKAVFTPTKTGGAG